MRYPEVYNQNLERVAILENAFEIGYEKRMNELWTAHFSLPLTDPKNAECLPMRFVEIFDGEERVDLFRIIPTETAKDESTRTVTYRLEHVLATLLDDVLFQYHQIGGTGIYTPEVLQYILSAQTTVRWQLGTVEFARQFLYNWENENLLAALFSVPKPFNTDYMWTWDTTSFPWTLNLVAPPDVVQAYIRYKKNLRGITKEEDPTNLCTRLYALGYGEGVNQLGIESANPTGLPYIDSDTQGQFGVISRVWVDRRYESAETLFAAAKAMLEELKMPRVAYTVDAADLYQITQASIDRFQPGARVRVTDEDLGEFVARVIGVSKSDVTGAPGDVQVEIANRPQDIGDSVASLADRTRINEVYAQGATNLDSQNFADNCDPDFPAVLRFWIPDETVRINKMQLSYQTEAFRSYARAVEGGGAYADTTASGGGTTTTTASGGGDFVSTTTAIKSITVSSSRMVERIEPGFGQLYTTMEGSHNHGIPNGASLALAGGGAVTWSAIGNHSHLLTYHGHQIDIPGHDHGVSFNVPSHQHGVSIPNHSHGINIPDHAHGIEHGIFQGPAPESVKVRVDGNLIPGLGLSETDIDIVPYLAKDGGGRIQRGWHEITITPDKLGRIVANVVSQFFVQSRGGGDY